MKFKPGDIIVYNTTYHMEYIIKCNITDKKYSLSNLDIPFTHFTSFKIKYIDATSSLLTTIFRKNLQ